MQPDLQIQISYNGQDVTNFFQPNLISFRYTDACEFKADTVEIVVADPLHLILLYYQFQIGQSFSIVLTSKGFTSNLGTFYLSDIEAEGPPSEIKLKLSVIKPFSAIKHQKRTRGEENISLQALASQIASRNGYTLNYQSSINPSYSRTDQTDQSDLTYLSHLCEEAGLGFKLKNIPNQIIIFSEADYEQRPITHTFSLNPQANQIIRWRLNAKATDTYGSSTVSYMNPKTGLVTSATVKDPDGQFQGDEGPELVGHDRPSFHKTDTATGDEGYE